MDTKNLAELATLNLAELAKAAPDITINVKLGDLCKFHQVVMADTRKELEEIVISEKSEIYYSPKQVCEILGVDKSTLWRWTKNKGYLVPIEVGGKRKYRRSDLTKILNGGKKTLQNQ